MIATPVTRWKSQDHWPSWPRYTVPKSSFFFLSVRVATVIAFSVARGPAKPSTEPSIGRRGV